jgi:hypothetical protein
VLVGFTYDAATAFYVGSGFAALRLTYAIRLSQKTAMKTRQKTR